MTLQASGRCECESGFVGQGCELALGENQGGGRWYNVSAMDSAFHPRAAAAGAFLPSAGALYLFGGKWGAVGGWGAGQGPPLNPFIVPLQVWI